MSAEAPKSAQMPGAATEVEPTPLISMTEIGDMTSGDSQLLGSAKKQRRTKGHDKAPFNSVKEMQNIARKKEKNRQAAAASRARKKEYVLNLEKAIKLLTTEKLELQIKVAALTNELWERSIEVEALAKMYPNPSDAKQYAAAALAEAKGNSIAHQIPERRPDMPDDPANFH